MRNSQLHKLSGALIVTYGNALLGVAGCVAVLLVSIDAAFILLVISALFDVFDGVVARMNIQTPNQKRMGIVADSIADMISFGALPALILIAIAGVSWLTLVAAVVYVGAAIHRLVVFTAHALEHEAPIHLFRGLPVLLGAGLLVMAYILFYSYEWFPSMYVALTIIIGMLYVSDIPIPKPRGTYAYISYPLLAGVFILGIVLW